MSARYDPKAVVSSREPACCFAAPPSCPAAFNSHQRQMGTLLTSSAWPFDRATAATKQHTLRPLVTVGSAAGSTYSSCLYQLVEPRPCRHQSACSPNLGHHL